MTETPQAEPAFDPAEARPEQDALASQEATKFARGENLEDDGRRQEHRRHQAFRNQVHRALVCLFWAIVVCVGVGVGALVYTWHLLAPTCWHWLDEDAINKLERILTPALLSGAFAGYVNRRMAG